MIQFIAQLPRTLLVILLLGTNFLGIIIMGVMIFIMGREGRYFLKRGFGGGGVDVIKYDRMSNSFHLKSINKKGEYWTDGNNNELYESIEQIKGIAEGSDTFNRAVSNTPHWNGNRRGVLLAVEELFWVFTPDFVDLMQKSHNNPHKPSVTPTDSEYFAKDELLAFMGGDMEKEPVTPQPETGETQKNIIEWFKDKFKSQIRYIHLMNPINPEVISNHIDGATAYALKRAHDEGEDSGILKMTKPKKGIQLGTKGKIAIGASAIFAIIILIVILQKGGLPIPGLSRK
jgi:hypothetical protein